MTSGWPSNLLRILPFEKQVFQERNNGDSFPLKMCFSPLKLCSQYFLRSLLYKVTLLIFTGQIMGFLTGEEFH